MSEFLERRRNKLKRGLMILVRTLGDVIIGNTLSKGIKAKFPDFELDWIVEAKYKNVLENNPDIKNIIAIDEIGKDWDRVLRMAACDEYDEVFMFNQTSHTDSLWHHSDRYRFGHLLDFYARRCGIPIPERKLFMYPSEEDFLIVKAILEKEKIVNSKIVAIHTTTLVSAKDWNIEKFGELAKFVSGKDFYVCQIGAPTDRKIEGNVIDFRGRFTFRQIAAFLAGCEFFVGLDSGISYIAASQGIPVICIMGMSMPVTSGPFGDNIIHIEPTNLPPECAWRCHTNCKFGQYKECINTIGIDRVIEAIEKVL